MGSGDEATQGLLGRERDRTDGGTFQPAEQSIDPTQPPVLEDVPAPTEQTDAVPASHVVTIEGDNTIVRAKKQLDLEKLVGRFGKLTTLTAMLPQGGFAWLLMDKEIFNSWHPLFRLIAGGSIFVTAVAGKYAIVWYFNEGAFQKLVGTKWLNACHYDNWSANDMVKTSTVAALTVPISLTFGGLAVMGTRGVSVMLKDYDMGFTNFLSDITGNVAIQAIPTGAAIFANFLSFPGIWNMTYGFFNSLMKKVRETKTFQLSQQEYKNDIEAVRLYIKALVKKGHLQQALDEYTSLLNLLNVKDISDEEREENLRAVIARVIAKSREDAVSQYKPNKPGFLQRKMHLTIPPILIAATITGLYNFFPLARTASDNVIDLLDDLLQIDFLSTILKPTTFLSSPISFLAMAAMSTSVMGAITGKIVVDRLFRREVPLNTLSYKKEFTKDIVALSTAILGAFPNLYQALILDNEPVPLASFAIWSSFALELPGLLTLMHKFLNKETLPEAARHKTEQLLRIIFHRSLTRANDKRDAQKQTYADKTTATQHDAALAWLRDYGYTKSELNNVPSEERYCSANPWKLAQGAYGYMKRPFAWCCGKGGDNTQDQYDRLEDGRVDGQRLPPQAPQVPTDFHL